MQIVQWLSKQANKIVDNISNDYSFHIKSSEPDNKVDSSTVISLTTFTDRNQFAMIPCSFRWFRQKNQSIEERKLYKGNTYKCGISDIGSTIKVQVTSKNEQHSGVAYMYFGPVSIEPDIKQTIKLALAQGFLTFYAKIQCEGEQIQSKFKITRNSFEILQQNSQNIITLDYYFGSTQLIYKESNDEQLQLIFNDNQIESINNFIKKYIKNIKGIQQSIKLCFSNRKFRDQMILAIKAFNAQKQIKNSYILNKITKINCSEQNEIDILLELESLRTDISKLHKLLNKEKQEKFIYFSENLKLESEIEQIISSYSMVFTQKTEVIEQDFKLIHKRTHSASDLLQKYSSLENQNKRLREQVETLTEEYTRRMLLSEKVINLQQENITLKKEILAFKKKKQEQQSSFQQTSFHKLDSYLTPTTQPGTPHQIRTEQYDNQTLNLKDMITQLQIQKMKWKKTCQKLYEQIETLRENHQKAIQLYQDRINNLTQQISYCQRNNNVLNRSHNLSLEMQDYNYEQNIVLRQQNDFLLSQTEKLSKMCLKYKKQCHKLRQLAQTHKL